MPRPRSGSSAPPSRSGGQRALVVAGVLVLLLVAYAIYRRSRASPLNTSGTPGADRTGSGAQEPSGGAASVPGNLPGHLIDHTGTAGADVQEQVQTNDTTSAESPQAIAVDDAPADTPPGWFGGYVDPNPPTINGVQTTDVATIGGVGYEQTSPGSDYFVPVPPGEVPTGNIHTPGPQL